MNNAFLIFLLLISIMIFPFTSFQEIVDNSEEFYSIVDYNYIRHRSWETNDGIKINDETTQIKSIYHFETQDTFAAVNLVRFNVTSTVYDQKIVEEIFFIFHSPGETPENLITGDLNRGLQKLIENGHAFSAVKDKDSEDSFYLESTWLPQKAGEMVISRIITLSNGEFFPFTDTSSVFTVADFLAIEEFEANKEIFKQSVKLDEMQNNIIQLENNIIQLEKQNESSQNWNIGLAIISIGLAGLSIILGLKYKALKKSN